MPKNIRPVVVDPRALNALLVDLQKRTGKSAKELAPRLGSNLQTYYKSRSGAHRINLGWFLKLCREAGAEVEIVW